MPDAYWLQVVVAIRPEAFFAACLWQFAREFLSSADSAGSTPCAPRLRLALVLEWRFVVNLLPIVLPDPHCRLVCALQRVTGADPCMEIFLSRLEFRLVMIARRGRSAGC